MTNLTQRRLRILAVATLVALAGVILCLWLTLAHPHLGGSPNGPSPRFYLPPQAILVALLAPIAVALAFATCISSLLQSRLDRHSLWAGAFTGLLLLLLLGPTYLICGYCAAVTEFASSTYSLLPRNPDAVWFIAYCSAAVVGLTAICALLYAWSARSPDAPR